MDFFVHDDEDVNTQKRKKCWALRSFFLGPEEAANIRGWPVKNRRRRRCFFASLSLWLGKRDEEEEDDAISSSSDHLWQLTRPKEEVIQAENGGENLFFSKKNVSRQADFFSSWFLCKCPTFVSRLIDSILTYFLPPFQVPFSETTCENFINYQGLLGCRCCVFRFRPTLILRPAFSTILLEPFVSSAVACNQQNSPKIMTFPFLLEISTK